MNEPQGVVRVPRYRLLDAWRAIAALWVALFHFTYAVQHERWHPYMAWLKPLATHGYLGVNLFFVISGYAIAAFCERLKEQAHPLRKFVQQRALRLMPTYWLALLLTVGINVVVWRFSSAHQSPLSTRLPTDALSWLGNIFLVQPYVGVRYISLVYWSLVVEIGFYVLVLLLMRVPRSWRLYVGGLIAVVGCLWPGHALFNEAMPITILRSWPEFCCGVLVYLTHRRWCRGQSMVSWPLWSLGALGIFSGLSPYSRLSGHVGLVWFGCLFSLLLIILLRWDAALSSHRSLSGLLRIGAFSYSLYLLHYPLGVRAMVPVQRDFSAGSLFYFAWLLLDLTVTTLVVWALYQGIEKPFQQWRQRSARPALPAEEARRAA